MASPEAYDYWEHRGLGLLWAAMLLPLAAWGIDELLGYSLVKPVCASGQKVILFRLSAAMLSMVVIGAAIGWSCLTRLREGRLDGGSRIDRSQFLAIVAIGFNVLIGLLIVTAAVPAFILNPCE
jgi:hypothetical protein